MNKGYDCLEKTNKDFVNKVIRNNRTICKERFQERKYVSKINDIYVRLLKSR